MGKNKYTISTVFTADNRNFISALEKNKKTFDKFKDNTQATQKKLQTLWNTTHKASKSFDTMRNSVKASTIAMGTLMASAVTRGASAIVNYSKSAIMAASDAQEMQQKFNTVFKGMEKEAEQFAKDFVGKVGGSVLTVKKQMANTQDLLTGFGASRDAAFGLSKQIQSLGTDLAAFNNMSEDEAVDRLRKGLLGEHENLKALGIIINENALKQELSARGDKRKLQTLTELEKIELRYAIAVKQSTNAIGSAEREADGFARQLETFKGNMENLAVTIGSKLLPPLTTFITYVNSNFDVIVAKIRESIQSAIVTFQEWSPTILKCVAAFMTFKTIVIGVQVIQGILSVIEVMKALKNMQLGCAAAQSILNAICAANPWTLAIAGIGAVIAVFMNWDNVIKTVTNSLKGLWNGFAGLIGLDSLKFDIDKDKTPKYATGTNYHKGGMALVGEHGPELLNLSKGATVTPADKTKQILSSNNKSQVFNIAINGYNRGTDEIVDELVRKLKVSMVNC